MNNAEQAKLAVLALRLNRLADKLRKSSPPHEGGWSARTNEASQLSDIASELTDLAVG